MTLALCALACNAHAGRVYKCANGAQTIYQTVPCPPEQDTGVTRPIVKDPNLTWEERPRAQRDLHQARRRHLHHHLFQLGHPGRRRHSSACRMRRDSASKATTSATTTSSSVASRLHWNRLTASLISRPSPPAPISPRMVESRMLNSHT